ncbi:MAG: hypothetical protein Q9222_004708 [Ikaeria aurantiellina]
MPPAGMRVRFLSMATNKCLACDGGYLYHRDMDKVTDAMWWRLQRESPNSNRYNIIHDVTEMTLLSDFRGAWVGSADDMARWFVFEQGTGRRMRYFRLINNPTNSFIFSRTTKSPEVCGNSKDGPLYDDQYFAFIFEDMAVARIVYKIPDSVMSIPAESTLTSIESGNHTGEPQKKTVVISKTIEEESSFESQLGFTLTIGTEFKTGFPGIVDGKVSTELSISTNFTWGSVHRSSTTWSDTIEINMLPNTNYRVVGKASRAVIDVPFTATLRSPVTGVTTTMEGVYKGVTHFDFKSDYWPL